MKLVETVAQRTEDQLQSSGRVLQEILVAAADEQGEWYLPLTGDQVAAMRRVMDANEEALNEALLSNAFSWIRKCHEDRFDSMAKLIQKVLQLYAARNVRVATGGDASHSEAAAAFNAVVDADEEQWEALLKEMAGSGRISEASFMEVLQRQMEALVLGVQSGSYAQRVMAEYLKELEQRARAVFKSLA